MAPAQFLCHVAHAPPRPPQGPSGKGVVLTLTALAFVTYLSIFAIRKRSGKDARSWKVFWLDLMKMGIGQGFAWIINVVNSHRNSEMAAGEGESFDAVSWYFPTFMNDELIAVPLGVGLWQLWTRLIRSLAAQGYTAEWIQALAVSGRYHPNQGELTRSQSGRIYLGGKAYDANRRACGCVGAIWNGCCTPLCKAGGCGDADPEVKYDWWFVQLFFWVLCVLLSRILGGLVVPFFHTVMGDNSPCAARAHFGGGAMLRGAILLTVSPRSWQVLQIRRVDLLAPLRDARRPRRGRVRRQAVDLCRLLSHRHRRAAARIRRLFQQVRLTPARGSSLAILTR